jgi:DNA-binding NtrC family response regulator
VDLGALQAAGRFRRDLYHRLKTHHVNVPPLRKRLDDIPLLVDHFLEKAATALGKKKPSPPKELYALLAAHPFPGNVRELESMVADAVAHHESRMMSMAVFETHIARDEALREPAPEGERGGPYALFDRLPSLRESSSMLIAEAMHRAEGNQSIAARLLGISRTALNKRLNHGED